MTEATSIDLDALCWLASKRKVFQERFAHNEKCFVVRKEEQILAMLWVCLQRRREPMLGTIFELGPKTAWVYDGYTKETARGRGYHALLLDRATEYAERSGCEETCGWVDETNRRSLQTHQRFGYEIVGELAYTRVGPLQRVRWQLHDGTVLPHWWGPWWRQQMLDLSLRR